MSHQLIETDVKLIVTHLQNNMPAALADVSTDRGDNKVALQVPTDYFTYETASGFRPPVVYVIARSVDFRLSQKANYISALSKITVSMLIETDKNPNLTLMAYRYQAALHKLLAQTQLLSSDNKVQIVIKVDRAEFSSTFTNAGQKGNVQERFRKEVTLLCDVEHYEELS